MNLIQIQIQKNFIKYKCLCCNKNYRKVFDENLKERVFNTYKFSNHNIINKFILLLRKTVYSYEFMDDWENLNMEDLTDADYVHRKSF